MSALPEPDPRLTLKAVLRVPEGWLQDSFYDRQVARLVAHAGPVVEALRLVEQPVLSRELRQQRTTPVDDRTWWEEQAHYYRKGWEEAVAVLARLGVEDRFDLDEVSQARQDQADNAAAFDEAAARNAVRP